VVYSNNQTDRHDITETLLKMALNTITPYSRSKDYLVGSEKLALKGALVACDGRIKYITIPWGGNTNEWIIASKISSSL
jgi:hypothetical protein